MNVSAIETEFDSVIAAWDVHIDHCPVCLVEGTTLCYEGQYLSEEVTEVREALGAAEAKARAFLEAAAPVAPLADPGAVA